MNGKRRIFEDRLYVHFVTFSCYHRRKLLTHEIICQIVLGNLDQQLKKFVAKCVGFVLMPDHVHVLLRFSQTAQLVQFMKNWKQSSGYHAKQAVVNHLPEFSQTISAGEPFWQRKYYDFPIECSDKLTEKLNYILQNPVRAGLVDHAADWKWSSARWYERKQFSGIDIHWVD